MQTDVMLGILTFGNACLKRNANDQTELDSNKERFKQELSALRSKGSDGSFDDFDVALRAAYKQFMSAHPRSAISHWLNEATTLLLPHPNPLPTGGSPSGDNVVTVSFTTKRD